MRGEDNFNWRQTMGTVTEAINACDGIQDVTINLESGQTFIYGNNVNKQQIITKINNVGFSIGEIA